MKYVLAVLILLGAACAQELPNAPSAQQNGQAGEFPPRSWVDSAPVAGRTRLGSRHFGEGPSIGASYWLSTGALYAATIVDIQLVNRCLNGVPQSCTMVPSGLRSKGAMYGIGLPMDAGISYLGYVMKRKGNKAWAVPAALFTAGHAVYAYHAAVYTHGQ